MQVFRKSNKIIFRIVLTGFVLCSFVTILLMLSIYKYSFVTEDIQADAAIVLGAAVWENAPSPVFEERINHAINLYENEKISFLIFTGGVGDEDERAESEVAKDYAMNKGIPENAIYIETSSKITFENLKESIKIMNKADIDSVLIVSDPLHMKRAMAMTKDLGMIAYSSPTPTSLYKSWRTKLKFLLWETYYYAGYLVKKALSL